MEEKIFNAQEVRLPCSLKKLGWFISEQGELQSSKTGQIIEIDVERLLRSYEQSSLFRSYFNTSYYNTKKRINQFYCRHIFKMDYSYNDRGERATCVSCGFTKNL